MSLMLVHSARHEPRVAGPVGKSVSNSLTYMPEDFQAVIDGMATGSYTTEGG